MSANAGHYDIVELLLNFGANIEAKTSMSRTPLHISCMRGHTHIIQLLVSRGADINTADNDFCTPLHIASEHGFADVVIFLLEKNAQVTPKNHAGLTCIDVANSVEIRKIFENRGLVNENTISGFGRTYMDDALLYNSRLDMIGKLLMVGNMNSKFELFYENQYLKFLTIGFKESRVLLQTNQVLAERETSLVSQISTFTAGTETKKLNLPMAM